MVGCQSVSRLLFGRAATLLLGMSVLSATAQAGPTIVVMTQNMDEGTDYQALLAAHDVPSFLSASRTGTLLDRLPVRRVRADFSPVQQFPPPRARLPFVPPGR